MVYFFFMDFFQFLLVKKLAKNNTDGDTKTNRYVSFRDQLFSIEIAEYKNKSEHFFVRHQFIQYVSRK